MIVHRTKNTKYIRAFALFLVLIVTVCSTPILNRGILFGLLSIFSLLYITVAPHTYLTGRKSTLLPVGAFLLLIFSYRLIGYSDAIISRYILWTTSLLILLLTPIADKVSFTKYNNNVLKISVLLCVFNIAWNIYMSYLNPYFHEYMDMFSLEELYSINMGGSDFYTFSLFFYILSLFLYINLDKNEVKLTMLLCAIVSGIFVLWFCFKASVVVLMLMSTVLLFLLKGKTRLGGIPTILLFVFVVVILLFALFSNEIIDFIVAYSPSHRLTDRLVALIDADSNYANTASLEARQDLWLLSLNTWIESPRNFIFGIGDHYMPGGNSESGIGQHSQFFDILAAYGVIGGLLVFFMLKRCWTFIVSMFEKKYQIQIYIILLVYLICGFTRTIFIPSVSCVLYIMLPLFSRIINNPPKVIK